MGFRAATLVAAVTAVADARMPPAAASAGGSLMMPRQIPRGVGGGATADATARRVLQGAEPCDIKSMQTQLDRIDDACCRMPDGTPLDCTAGPPVQCTATCADTFLPFWSSCRDASVYGQTDEVHFDAFNTQCDATHANDEGENSIGNNVLDPTLCSVDKKHTFAWVEISPLEMGHCIGATPQEQAACGAAPPRTGITTADVGTLIGFNDWTSGGRNTWAADDGWYDVTLDWGFTWYGREEHTITIGTNGVLSFGTPQYMYGGSEPVPCHGHSQCGDGNAQGIGMDGVIAVFWTDLDPGKVTDCPQTHHCGGGGNVYYKKDTDHLVRLSPCPLLLRARSSPTRPALI